MYSKEYDKNIEICKIHHKRKEYENTKIGRNRFLNIFKKISMLGIVLIMFVSIAGATGTSSYNAILDTGQYKLVNNVWGASYSEKQSGSLYSYIYYNADGKFGWQWSRNPGKNYYVPPIYPEAYKDLTQKRIQDIISMSAELQYRWVNSPTGSYNLAYDIFLTSYGNRKAEVMVWLDCTIYCAPAQYIKDVNDGYNTYGLYYKSPTAGSWHQYVYVLKNRGSTYNKVDLKTLLNALPTNINRAWTLSRVEFGSEIWKGSGKIEISKWLINYY